MAYQLKTTGIAANCTMCIAVDPDTNTIKDFASSAVTADMSVGANVTIGSQGWDGITRKYWQIPSGTTDADFVKFGTNKPLFNIGASDTERTIVWIGEVAGPLARAFGNSSSEYFMSRDSGSGGNTWPTAYVGANALQGNGTALTSGQKAIWGHVLRRGTDWTAYRALDTDTSMGSNTGSLGAVNVSYSLTYLNRRNDTTAHQTDKTHAILIFNTALSGADWDSLRDDWFGTLLEVVGGGGGATADGVTLTATASLTAGSASGVSNATAGGVTLTATASLISGSASAGGSATADGVTLTATASLISGSASGVINGVLNFQAAGLEFGARTGLGIDTFGLENGKDYRYTVHADGLTLGAAIVTSSVITLDSTGKLPNLVSASLTPGTNYRVVAVRQTDGEAAIFRLTAS